MRICIAAAWLGVYRPVQAVCLLIRPSVQHVRDATYPFIQPSPTLAELPTTTGKGKKPHLARAGLPPPHCARTAPVLLVRFQTNGVIPAGPGSD